MKAKSFELEGQMLFVVTSKGLKTCDLWRILCTLFILDLVFRSIIQLNVTVAY